MNDLTTGTPGISIRNAGNELARAPWIVIAIGEDFFVLHNVGIGFLGVDEARYLVVDEATFPRDNPDSIVGVAGCRSKSGDIWAWSIDGGRRRTFSSKRWKFWRSSRTSWIDIFRAFHGRKRKTGTHVPIRSDRPAEGH